MGGPRAAGLTKVPPFGWSKSWGPLHTERAQASQLDQFTFTMADHLTLRDKVAASPHKVCISYDNHPAIRELYSDFHIIEESWTYSGTSGAQRAVGQELVITNYEPLDYEVNPTAGEV